MPTSAREESARLQELLRREHHTLAEFLVALSEFDRARQWMALGYASLFDYLCRHLALSKGAAFYRMTAARLVRERPAALEPLRLGQLCLTTVVEVAKVLTAENEAEVLPRFFGLSKREARVVVAELRPAEVVPSRTVVTAVPERRPAELTGVPAMRAPAAVDSAAATGRDVGQPSWPVCNRKHR